MFNATLERNFSIETPDQPGSLAEVTQRLAKSGLNIKFIFTTIFDGEPAVIANTDNNKKH